MRYVGTLMLIVLSQVSIAQIGSKKIELLDSLQSVNPRPSIVFIHTDWCKYCQAMKHTTFLDDDITNLLSNEFYFFNLNAESTQTIELFGEQFQYKPNGKKTGIHELAELLGTVNNRVTYPTVVFLSEENEIIYQHVGFISADELRPVLANWIAAKD